ncbi:MAG TPA: hypothetical protein DDY87_05040 [Clostridiales bacterium]|nr:hypothetical protein [Clostridiales bacterium]
MQKQERKSAAITLAAMIFVLLLAVGLVVELLRIYVPDIWAALSSGKDGALEACLEGQSKTYSACLLWLLSFVQVISIVLPSLPIQLAAGIVLGSWLGAAVCLSGSVLSHMTVFFLAKHAKKQLNALADSSPRMRKMLGTLSVRRNRTYYTVMVLLAPGLPNGIIPYAAANSGIAPSRYLLALLIALPLPTWVTCAAGDLILSGDWMFSIGMMAVLFAVVGLLLLVRDSLPDRLYRFLDKWKIARK